MRFWVNFIEKYGRPTIVATTENNLTESESQQLMEQLLQMHDHNSLVVGGNIDVKLHDFNKTGNLDLYQHLIEICNAEISKVILSGTLTTEIKTGSYAASQTHQEIRKEVIESDLLLIEKHINRLIEDICELNFGSVELPFFIFEKADEIKN